MDMVRAAFAVPGCIVKAENRLSGILTYFWLTVTIGNLSRNFSFPTCRLNASTMFNRP